jgi:hypothetical protein
MILPPLIGLLILALTTVYGFFVNTFALWLGAKLLALEKKGLKPAFLTALVYTIAYAVMFTVSYLSGIFSDLLSLILVYVTILFSTILLIPLIKLFYKMSWRKASTMWLLVLGVNTVLSVLLSLALALLTTAAKIILP